MAHKNKTNVSPYKSRQNSQQNSLAAPLLGRHRKPQNIYGIEEANERLYDIFRNHGFSVSHEERVQLAHLYYHLMQSQEQNNFTRLLSLKDIAIKHFMDSLIVSNLTELKFPLLDVGTGPGFPGIPLKIRFKKEKIILAEGVQKRVEFLKFLRDQLKLSNLDIIGRNINAEFHYPIQGAITRALEDVSNTLQNISSSLEVGGKVFFMKGPGVDPEIKMARDQWSKYFALIEDKAYVLPETPYQRRLLIYEKIALLPEEIKDIEFFQNGHSLSDEEKIQIRTYMKDNGD